MAGSRATEAQPRTRPGRPRSEESRAAVLRATSELLHEVGLRAMTTEEIASRSGASKATIYKWWPNKYAVAIDAFLSEMMAESPDPDTGSARDDLSLVLRGLMHFYTGPSGRVYAQLVGEAQTRSVDPAGTPYASGGLAARTDPGDLGSWRRPR